MSVPISAETAAPESTPLPPRPRAPIALVVLATLAVGFTLWAAQDVVLPVLLAAFFALVGNPIIRLLRRLHLPRFLAALIVLLGGLAGAGVLGVQLWQPASAWFNEAPRELRQLAPFVGLACPFGKGGEPAFVDRGVGIHGGCLSFMRSWNTMLGEAL